MYFHKMNKFKENEQFSMVLSIGQQNEHILRIFKRQLANVWCDYGRIVTYFNKITEKYQFFQPNALPFAVSSQKIVYFHEMNSFK